jgi:hypothetical protein
MHVISAHSSIARASTRSQKVVITYTMLGLFIGVNYIALNEPYSYRVLNCIVAVLLFCFISLKDSCNYVYCRNNKKVARLSR